MSAWKEWARRGLVTGNLAGLASLATLAWRGRRERGDAVMPLNAPSHWLWGDRALRQHGASARYTGVGVLIHQASASMWGVLYEACVVRGRRRTPPVELRDAAAATCVAAAVDLVFTPRRLRPGFERQLSPAGLAWTYGVFALAVAAGSHLAARPRA